MRNLEAASAGDDHAFDNIRAYDVTPGIGGFNTQTRTVNGKIESYPTGGLKFDATKPLKQGESTKLTITVSNSKEKNAKAGWSFKTDLGAIGLKVAPTPGGSTTCRTTSTFNPVAGASSVDLAGNFNTNDTSCTMSFNVTNKDTTSTVQKLTLDKNAFKGVSGTDPVGMNRPADDATVTFVPTPTLELAGSSTFNSNTRPGETFTNTITGTNTSTSYSYTASNPNNPAIINNQ
jgi:hypothetical protein